MKIGLCLVTYNRIEFLKQSLQSIISNNFGGAKELIVVDDASTDGTFEYLKQATANTGIAIYSKSENKGVGNSKNIGMQHLLDVGCTDIFVMEDDIIMRNPKTCLHYIAYARRHKLQHLNFGLHGTMNINKAFYNYEGIYCFPECIGAFSYYTREVLEVVGLIDEYFVNAWEHVEHTYRIANMGYTTPFWQFADCPNSYMLLSEIPNSLEKSVIRPNEDWEKNVIRGKKYWEEKHGTWLPPRPPNNNEYLETK